jgi:hypothetical protein
MLTRQCTTKLLFAFLSVALLLAFARPALANYEIQTFGGNVQDCSGHQCNLCLTVEGGTVKSDTCGNNQSNQSIIYDGNFIWEGGTSNCLTSSTSACGSVGLCMSQCNYTTNQTWRIEGSELSLNGTSSCLGVQSASSTPGTPLVLQTCSGPSNDSQAFWVEGPANEGVGGWTFYLIHNKYGGACGVGGCCLREEQVCLFGCTYFYDLATCSTSDANQQFVLVGNTQHVKNPNTGNCITYNSSTGSVVPGSCSGGSSIYTLWEDSQWTGTGWTQINNTGPFDCLGLSLDNGGSATTVIYESCNSSRNGEYWAFGQ